MNFSISGAGSGGLLGFFIIFGAAMLVFVLFAAIVRQRLVGTGKREPGDERTDNDDPL